MVVAMAINPFSRQVIQYYNCLQVLPGRTSRISRTNNYMTGGFSQRPGYAELGPAMNAAIYTATVDGTSIVAFDCMTGNCTFPAHDGETFATLGMCSSCIDISDRIQANGTSGVYWSHGSTDGRPVRVGYVAPGTVNPYWLLSVQKLLAQRQDFDDLIMFNALMLNVEPACNLTDTTTCTKYPWEVQCSLYPCVKIIGANVTNASLNERIISSIPLKKTIRSAVEVTTSENLTWSLATDTTLRGGSRQKCATSQSIGLATPVKVFANKTVPIGSVPDGQTVWYPNDCVWILGCYSALALNEFLSTLYNNSVLMTATENTAISVEPVGMKLLYQSGRANITTVNKWVDGIAKSITTMMRQHGDSTSTGYATGSVLAMQTCIHVEWVWISLPVSLAILAVAFFVAVLVKSHNSNAFMGAWRSSSLALLFHGLDNDARRPLGQLDRKSKMEAAAEKLRVRMERAEDGWTFVGDRAVVC